MKSLFDGKKILITGGTGSLGTALTKRLLKTEVETIRIYSRDEWKQVQMESKLHDKRLRFFIGDVRDRDRLSRAMEEVDIVIHAAALKQVPVAEYNPFECIQTNVMGAQNVVTAAIRAGVRRVVALSTDKSANPINLYGASKLAGEQQILQLGCQALILRTAWVYSRYGGNFVKTMLRLMSEREQLSIVADQVGSPSWAADLASTIWRFAELPALKGIYHWTNEGAISWYDFAVAIQEEALAVGTYCALTARNFSEGVIMAVNHDGDSDSTGAIAGNLLGLIWGEEEIPTSWLKRLELRKVITKVADDLYACREWSIGPHAESEDFSKQVWARYPGH